MSVRSNLGSRRNLCSRPPLPFNKLTFEIPSLVTVVPRQIKRNGIHRVLMES